MKKSIFAALFLALFSMNIFAQEKELKPGLYAVNGDEYLPISNTSGKSVNSGSSFFGFEIGKKQYEYKGTTSENPFTGTFLMVCDPNKENVRFAWGKYEPFVKSMTPDNMLIIPLNVEKKKRVYVEGTTIMGINTTSYERDPFTWEKISDYAYLITTELQPGEYGIVFKAAELGNYEFTAIFDFTVPAEAIEE